MNDIQTVRERERAAKAAEAHEIEQFTLRLKELIAQLRGVGLPEAKVIWDVPYKTVPKPAWYNRKRTVELKEYRPTWTVADHIYLDTEAQMYAFGIDLDDRCHFDRLDPSVRLLKMAVEYLERIARENCPS